MPGKKHLKGNVSAKEQRQYEHIKESEKGKGSKASKRIAAATVNKERKKRGETKS